MGICHVKELVKKATKDFRAKKYMSDFYKAKCAMYFEGPQCPFGLVSAPCHGAKGLSQGGNRVDAAHRCALDRAEGPWHPKAMSS